MQINGKLFLQFFKLNLTLYGPLYNKGVEGTCWLGGSLYSKLFTIWLLFRSTLVEVDDDIDVEDVDGIIEVGFGSSDNLWRFTFSFRSSGSKIWRKKIIPGLFFIYNDTTINIPFAKVRTLVKYKNRLFRFGTLYDKSNVPVNDV